MGCTNRQAVSHHVAPPSAAAALARMIRSRRKREKDSLELATWLATQRDIAKRRLLASLEGIFVEGIAEDIVGSRDKGVVRRPIPSRFGCGLGSQCLVLCQTDSAGCSFSEAQHLHVPSRLGRRLRGDD